jgi:hypothetical protein
LLNEWDIYDDFGEVSALGNEDGCWILTIRLVLLITGETVKRGATLVLSAGSLVVVRLEVLVVAAPLVGFSSFCRSRLRLMFAGFRGKMPAFMNDFIMFVLFFMGSVSHS